MKWNYYYYLQRRAKRERERESKEFQNAPALCTSPSPGPSCQTQHPPRLIKRNALQKMDSFFLWSCFFLFTRVHVHKQQHFRKTNTKFLSSITIIWFYVTAKEMYFRGTRNYTLITTSRARLKRSNIHPLGTWGRSVDRRRIRRRGLSRSFGSPLGKLQRRWMVTVFAV